MKILNRVTPVVFHSLMFIAAPFMAALIMAALITATPAFAADRVVTIGIQQELVLESSDAILVDLEADRSYACEGVPLTIATDFDFSNQVVGQGASPLTFTARFGGDISPIVGGEVGDRTDNRVIVTPTQSDRYRIEIEGAAVGGESVLIRCYETTLFGGFNTNVNDFNFLELTNIGNATITARVSAIEFDDTVALNNAEFAVPAGQRVDVSLHDFAGMNKFGFVRVTHDAPLGTLNGAVSQYFGTVEDFRLGGSQQLKHRLNRRGHSAAGSTMETSTGDGTFETATSLTVGDDAWGVELGDLNGDSILDVVSADRADDTISVLLGNGDGTFQPRTTFATGDGPIFVAIADLNGDGALDVVTPNIFDSTLSVLLGNGDGSFQAAANLALAGTAPFHVAVGDLNSDGALDLVTADRGPDMIGVGDNMSVLLGNGDGTFQAATAVATGDQPRSTSIADLNGDGVPDLVSSYRSNDINNPGTTISLILGNGDGTFQPQTLIDSGDGPNSTAIGHLNADGALDIVIANRFPDTVSVLLGNGDGTFQPRTTFATGDAPQIIRLADLNGDGALDIASPELFNAGGMTPGQVSVLLGNGDGTFQPRVVNGTLGTAATVAIGDVNGDGALDIVGSDVLSSSLSVLLGNAR